MDRTNCKRIVNTLPLYFSVYRKTLFIKCRYPVCILWISFKMKTFSNAADSVLSDCLTGFHNNKEVIQAINIEVIQKETI
jgi:hypothetical protein